MSLDDGWIVSIILGVVLLIVVVIFVIYVWFYRKKNYVSAFEDMPVVAEKIDRISHDKWEELLKNAEDEKRQESHRYTI